MKYSNYIGVAAAVLVIAFCFAPWVYIESIKTTITGFDTKPTNYGVPGVLHLIMSVLSAILFWVPAVWAKRFNLFSTTINFTWSIRNFLLITHCELGECPDKKAGIYAIIFLSMVMLAMALLPKVDLEK